MNRGMRRFINCGLQSLRWFDSASRECERERRDREGETAFAKGTKSAIIKEERIRERLE